MRETPTGPPLNRLAKHLVQILAQLAEYSNRKSAPDQNWYDMSSFSNKSITEFAEKFVSRDKHELDRGLAFRAYPTINAAALGENKIGELRIWYAARFIHRYSGYTSGSISLKDLIAAICDKASKYYFYSKRRLQEILDRGEGSFWRTDYGTLYFYSPSTVAHNLNTNLYGFRLDIPMKLLTTHQTARAAFYKSWEDGRRTDSPLSRYSIEKKTGIPERTQRRYDEILGASEIKNYVNTGIPYTIKNLHWLRGHIGDDRPLYPVRTEEGKAIKMQIASNRTRTFQISSNPGALKKWKKRLSQLNRSLGNRQHRDFHKIYYDSEDKVPERPYTQYFLQSKRLYPDASKKSLLSPSRVYGWHNGDFAANERDCYYQGYKAAE